MAPAMTGPQTAAAEIAKITAMIAHDHQSLSADCATVATLGLLRSTRRTFATGNLLGMTCEKKWACRRLACIPEMGDFGVFQTGGIEVAASSLGMCRCSERRIRRMH